MRRAIPLLTATFLALALCGTARAVVSNSIIQDDIEYYTQVDKAVYSLGEDVEMLYKVTNLTDQDVMFGFPHSPEWNFWVEKDGEHIWQAVEAWWTIPTSFILASGEYKEYPYIWDMKDNNGILVNLGQYDVIGGFDAGAAGNYEYSRVAVPITIVPEPCSLALFTTGLFVLMRNRKR